MKKIRLLLLMLAFTVMVVGCSKETKQKTEANTPTKVENQVEDKKEDTAEVKSEETAGDDNEEPSVPVEKVEMRVAALKGPTAMGMVKMMEDTNNGVSSHDYKFTIAGAADEITAGLVKGEYDIAAVPCNLASVLYNKTEGKIKIAAINTLGVLYVIETGDTIHSVEDLKGKTIYSTGFGTTPQYTLNYLLSSYGIDPEKDVTIEYKTEATEVAALLSNSENGIAMVPQPFVTTVMMNNDKVRIALDIAKEWDKIAKDESSVVTGVVVVRDEFLEKNKEVFNTFLEEYEDSAVYANSNIDETATLLEQFDIFKAAVAKKAIPFCNITMITGDEMESKVSGYLQTLFDQNPQSVGGKLPESDFYYKQ